MIVALNDLLSAILVGALWGCTNPLLRRGSAEAKRRNEEERKKAGDAVAKGDADADAAEDSHDGTRPAGATVRSALRNLLSYRRLPVLLPYLLNQSGSLLFYKLLATSDLTASVPTCNALALVFSVVTSYALGERVEYPWRAAAGSALVTAGVSVCAYSSSSGGEGLPMPSGDEL